MLDEYMVSVSPGDGLGRKNGTCSDRIDRGTKRCGKIHGRVSSPEFLRYAKIGKRPSRVIISRAGIGDSYVGNFAGGFPGRPGSVCLRHKDSKSEGKTRQLDP